MAKKEASTKAARRPGRAKAVFTWAPVPDPGLMAAPFDASAWFLRVSVVLMLAGMTYHLIVLVEETKRLAPGFAVACCLFAAYDLLARPRKPRATATPAGPVEAA